MINEEELMVYLKMPAGTFYLELVRNVTVNLAEKAGFSKEDLSEIEMAVDEALTNVIEHAYTGNKDVGFNNFKTCKNSFSFPVELRVKADQERILVILRDKGKRFDFDSYGKIDLDDYLSEMKAGGLGVCIIRTFMDKVEYKHRDDSGNELRMIKYLRNPGNAED